MGHKLEHLRHIEDVALLHGPALALGPGGRLPGWYKGPGLDRHLEDHREHRQALADHLSRHNPALKRPAMKSSTVA